MTAVDPVNAMPSMAAISPNQKEAMKVGAVFDCFVPQLMYIEGTGPCTIDIYHFAADIHRDIARLEPLASTDVKRSSSSQAIACC